MNKRAQIALLGGLGGLVGTVAVFLSLAIAFSSGEFLAEWADTKSPISLTEDAVLIIWALFLGLVFGIPLALVFSVLRRRAFWENPWRWWRELPESKRQPLSYFIIGLVWGIPGGLTGVRMGFRPETLPQETLTAPLVGSLIGSIGGSFIAFWSSYGPKRRAIGVTIAILLSAGLADCKIVGAIIAGIAMALLWPSSKKQVSAEPEAGESGPTSAGGDSAYRRS
jgi:hypothetical protein